MTAKTTGAPDLLARREPALRFYSWQNLATMPWNSPAGEATLQDYWRLDPATGKSRSDASLRRSGELRTLPSGNEVLVYHLPDHRLDLLASRAKARVLRIREAGLRARLLAALPVVHHTAEFWNMIGGVRRDTRAQFSGVVSDGAPFAGIAELNVDLSYARLTNFEIDKGAAFGPAADFRHAFFLGRRAVFEDVEFQDARFDGALFDVDPRFEGVSFAELAVFDGALFAAPPAFKRARFDGTASFNRAVFDQGARFEEATFGALEFNEAFLVNRSSFAEVQVERAASFQRTYIAGETSFKKARFGANTTFEHAKFAGGFDLEDADPDDDNDRRSYSEINFDGAHFAYEPDFSGARFMTTVHFGEARFGHRASFDGCVFSQTADFSTASFGRLASFKAARFEGYVTFAGDVAPSPKAEAKADAGDDATSHTKLDAAPDRVLKIDFSDVIFRQAADFQNRTFAEAVSFAGSVWQGRPSFHGAAFRDDVSFEGASFPAIDAALWPGPSSPRLWWWRKAWTTRGARKTGEPTYEAYRATRAAKMAAAIPPLDLRWRAPGWRSGAWTQERAKATGRTSWANLRTEGSESLEFQYAELERAFGSLRMAFKGLGASRREIRFFRLAQLARQRRLDRQEVSCLEVWISSLYGRVSDFGDSLWRPLASWTLLSLLFAAGFWLAEKPSWGEVWAHLPAWGRWRIDVDFASALQFTLQNAFKPFDVWSSTFLRPATPGTTGADELASVSWIRDFLLQSPLLGRLGASLYSIASLTLLFLFGLALKRRFQVQS